MNENAIWVIHDAIRHARDAIEKLACENYPFTDFSDARLEKMFYDLNNMDMTVTKIIREQKRRDG